MKYLKKLTAVFFSASVGMMMLTGCEGSELFDVNSPDWLQDRVDSIANAKANSNEDIYSVGATDYSSGWWAEFSHYYIIPDGARWTETFNLHINPNAPYTYKNFALLLTNDVERGGTGYDEYGAIRFDNQPSGNSEWGSIDRSCVTSTLTFDTDTDEGVQRLGGIVTLTVDRSSESEFSVVMTNGDVTKTYHINKPLDNLNTDASNDNIRCFLVPEGSYIDFLTCNIDQIRTSKAPDQQPKKMVLNKVPKKILCGTSLEDAMANITATVTYSDGGERTVPASSLSFVAIPDFETLGTKNIVAIYNKTYKDQNADKAISATATVQVVDKLCNMLGAADNSTAFFGVTSDVIKVNPCETVVTTFTNYGDGAANWDNYLIALVTADNSREYAVVRADNFGWGDGYAACVPSCSQTDWGEWSAAMNGAQVTAYITNNGDGTADIKAVAVGNNGKTYVQTYTGINTIEPDNMAFKLTLEKAHLEYDYVVGADDNSTPFFGATSNVYKVPSGMTVTTQFVNNGDGGANWDNYLVALVDDANAKEYAVVRADNFGWGDGYAACTPSCSQSDWGVWSAAMDGAKVTVSVTNVGDGTANIKAVAVGSDGKTYVQTYTGINTIEPDNLSYKLTLEKAHLTFEPFERPVESYSAKRAHRVR